jgi:hypothetical protein
MPMFGGTVRVLVLLTIFACFATPLTTLILAYGKLFGSLWDGSKAGLPPALQIPPAAPAPYKTNIYTGLLGEERARQIARLKALSGSPEQASGAAKSLQIIAVAFEDPKPGIAKASGATSQGIDDDGYRRLSLDLKETSLDAVVVVADQPIRWQLSGLAAKTWPHVGFEGYAAFDVRDGQPGTIAGFRIGSFGATEIMRASDPNDGDVSNRTTFCAAAQKWADHFGLSFGAVRFALLRDPSRISLGQRQPFGDGSIVTAMNSDELDRLCKQRVNRQ